jgi:hypothetical protein
MLGNDNDESQSQLLVGSRKMMRDERAKGNPRSYA